MTLEEQHAALDRVKEAVDRNHLATATASETVGQMAEEIRDLRMQLANAIADRDETRRMYTALKAALRDLGAK